MNPPAITADAFMRLIREQVGVGHEFGFVVDSLHRGSAILRLLDDARTLRPGPAISGPAQFTLADTALYAAVLAEIGLVPLAVTTDMTIHFLRRAPPGELIAEATLLKSTGSTLVGRVDLRARPRGASPSDPTELVAHAVGSYRVPPRRS